MDNFNEIPQNSIEKKQEILKNLEDFQRDYEKWSEYSEKKRKGIYSKYGEGHSGDIKKIMSKEDLSILEEDYKDNSDHNKKFRQFTLDVLDLLYQNQDVKWEKKTYKNFPENHHQHYTEEYKTKLNNNYNFELQIGRGAESLDGHDYRPTNDLYYRVEINGSLPLNFKDKIGDFVKGNANNSHDIPISNILSLKKSDKEGLEIIENRLEGFDDETKEKFKEQIIGLVDKLRENI